MEAYSSELIFYVNGKLIVEKNAKPEMTLLHYLRYYLHLSGPKLGCGEGGCGACTVTVSKYNPDAQKIMTFSVNACLAPLVTMDGAHIITVEGLGNKREGYHQVQTRIADFHGSQCGYCTPGIVMALYSFLKNNPTPTRHEIEEALDGNLCRCTGYRPLNDAVKSFAVDAGEGCPCAKGDSCCRNTPFKKATNVDLTAPDSGLHGLYRNARAEMKKKMNVVMSNSAMKAEGCTPYDSKADSMNRNLQFPSSLLSTCVRPLKFVSDQVIWYRPTTLKSMLTLVEKYPDAVIVVGNTEIGIQVRMMKKRLPVRICATDIPQLNDIKITDEGVSFGSSVSLSRVKQTFADILADPNVPEYKKRTAFALLNQIRWFASTQIRNVCSIGSNVMNASPISDMSPLLQAASAKLTIASRKNGRGAKDTRDFFLNYKVVDMSKHEILVSIWIPFVKPNEYIHSFKQGRRREDDIAIVTASMAVTLSNDNKVEEICLSYGGMAKICDTAKQTQQFLTGQSWTLENIKKSFPYLRKDFELISPVPGGMEEYRMTLAASFLFKFFFLVATDAKIETDVPKSYLCAGDRYSRELTWGKQVYQVPKDSNTKVGKGKKHLAARAQASGEAKYTTDLTDPSDCLHATIVGSTVAHGRILSVDAFEALGVPGVIGWFDHTHVQNNRIGDVIQDEWLFTPGLVEHVGQPIGVIVANDRLTAEFAAHLVKITYEELPAIFTIDEAIAKDSFHSCFGDIAHTITDGDVNNELKSADHVISGTSYVGGQEHFYLECHNALVVPREDSDITVYASTQNPAVTQQEIAHILGLDANRVTCVVKRLGGGFGGKETRSVNVAAYAAVAAHALNKPVRINLERDVDMSITGQRHPFKAEYTVGYNNDGMLKGLDIKIYNNAGYSLDLSMAVLDRAIFHIDNVYKWPALRVEGKCCKTNLPSNTAYRGFGGPQGMFFTENILEQVAKSLNISVNELKERNFYKENEKCHFRQELSNWTLPETWERMKERSNIAEKEAEIIEFNKMHRFKKRGMACTPTKFGISFTYLPLNQGGALVHIYRDGSVLVSHGGTEMGQGLHTKMVQVAAEALNIDESFVHVNETATDKVPNTSPTAASFSSDINGLAVLDACNKLKKLLEPVSIDSKSGQPKEWKQVITDAYGERIQLSATGFCKIDGIGYDFKTGEGTPFRYFTIGSAVSVVEIDCLTGGFTTLSTDIVMDLGASLNPVIDVGQIEGAFIQGLGWATMEEMVWGDNNHKWVRPGYLMTKGPGTYKIPGFNDTPLDFNVYLLRDRPNPITLHSSKAVGEPPFFLAVSVFFAIKEAITAARAEHGQHGYFPLNLPATCERIRMACCDDITDQFVDPTSEPSKFFQTKGSF